MNPRLPLPRRVWRLGPVAVVFALALVPLTLVAQRGAAPPQANPATSWADQVIKAEGYQTPQKELADAVLAPRYTNVSLTNASPDKKWFLDEIGDGPVPMNTFAKPFHELGGVFIDFQGNRARSFTIQNNAGIQIISATDGTRKKLQVPAGLRVRGAVWSPDSKSVAYFGMSETATHIYLADIATGVSRQVTTTPVLATLVSNFDFTSDGKQIVAVLVPDNRPAMPPAEATIPTGPEVKVALGGRSSLRTFPSLMHNPHDFALLEWHATGQVAIIDVTTRAVKKVGTPAMIRAIDLSPNGQDIRVTRMTKPFSYIVPVSSFGQIEEIWDTTGKALAKISERPINLGAIPDDPNDPNAGQGGGGGGGGRGGGANQTGKRELAWAADGQGLTYLEQQPAPANTANTNAAGGDATAAGGGRAAGGGAGGRAGGRGAGGGTQGPPRPDRLMRWLAPFDATSTKLIYENSTRMTGVRFTPDMQTIFYTETAGAATTDYAVYLSDPAQRYAVMKCTASEFYSNPGALVGARAGGAGGRGGGGGGAGGGRGGGGGCSAGNGPVLLSADGTSVFYQGTVYDKNADLNGPKTFIDKVIIKTGEKTRIYESENKDTFERVTTILDPDTKKFVLLREGPTTPPQNILLDGSNRKQLTNNEDIAPDLTHAPRQTVEISRPDGFQFQLSVMSPPNLPPGTKPPAIFWIYPSEYDTQTAYDAPDRTFNKNAFPNFGARSMQFFVRLGYAVITDTTGRSGTAGIPVVGPQGQWNNNYVNDLRNDLAAAIDELDRRGLIDRTRLAIGGHSYGAFSTVNAMVNTPFFKAGIAGDGAYNRTLTPFGFQSERRTLWEAPNVYFDMSPFLRADHLSGALLMYHGLADQNVGTDPINSERLFQALNELGKTTAMYGYPLEDHGPAARETLLDLWARWAAWLDKYVKNPQPNVKPAAAPNGRGGGQ
jgi:dipeptidyl aminopeptidase/acylaminoacyl peptidase